MLRNIFNYICIFIYLTIFNKPVLAQEDFPLTISAPYGYSEARKNRMQDAYQEMSKKMLDVSGFHLPKRPSIVLCKNHKEMLKIAQNSIPEWALAIAIPDKYLIAINLEKLDFISNNFYATIRHETCHLYLGVWEQTYKKRIPIWFNEGIAQELSGALDVNYQEDILDSVVFEKILPFSSLKYRFPKNPKKASQAYLQSKSMVNYLLNFYGPNSIKDILSHYAILNSFETAIETSLGMEFSILEEEWKNCIKPEPWWGWIWKIRNFFSIFTLMALLVLIAYWRQRQKDKKILLKWQEEEREEEEREILHINFGFFKENE